MLLRRQRRETGVPAPPKYTIFVSSTFEDLKEARNEVVMAILSMGHIPVGMEMFSADDVDQWRAITQAIDQCDYYVVLVARRYGSVDGERSFTEKEYDYAQANGIPTLAFLLRDDAGWPATAESQDLQTKLADFKAKLRKKPVGLWSSADDLPGRVAIALSKAFVDHPRPGWVRASEVGNAEMGAEITRLSVENAHLREMARSEERASEAAENERLSVIESKLMRLKRPTAVKYADAADWKQGPELTMLQIFTAIAPGLRIENDTKHVAIAIAVQCLSDSETPTALSGDWPFPRNWVDDLLLELDALGLVEPSTRRHHVSDKSGYWTLTDLGRKLMRQRKALWIDEQVEDKSRDGESPAPSKGDGETLLRPSSRPPPRRRPPKRKG